MKMKTKILCIIVCMVTVLFICKILNNASQDHRRSVPYNPQKINRKGLYQPFYGYTVVAMIDPSFAKLAERIQTFLLTSSLATSYSPLPANTYHMTIYSIYQCGNRMIPPVERWVNANGYKISNHSWLPDDVLREQNDKASCIIKKYLTEPLHIKFARLIINERGIKISLEVQDKSLEMIRNARDELVKIYEDLDLSMEPINEKLHMGLAYVYAPLVKLDVEEWNQLNKLVGEFNGARFLSPAVYLFDSMTNYIPYRQRNKIEC